MSLDYLSFGWISGPVTSVAFSTKESTITQSGPTMVATAVPTKDTTRLNGSVTVSLSMRLTLCVRNFGTVIVVSKRLSTTVFPQNHTSGTSKQAVPTAKEHQFVVSFCLSDFVLSDLVNPQGTCRGEICRCEKDFATEVSKIQKTWNKKYHVKHGFNRKNECYRRGTPEPGTERKCCGKRINFQLYNPDHKECCKDGTVATVGTCGGY